MFDAAERLAANVAGKSVLCHPQLLFLFSPFWGWAAVAV